MSDQTPRCPICSRELRQIRLRTRDHWFGLGESFELRECLDCQLAVTWPRPREEELAGYYPEQYDAWQRPPALLRILRGTTARVRGELRPYGRVMRRETGAILDVGCGRGCGRGDLAANFARSS